MIELFDFTYNDEQWDSIRIVVRDRLNLDADQIERQYEQSVVVLKQRFYTSGMRSLRGCIETAAHSHILRSACESHTPGHKALMKQLTALRNRAKALHVEEGARYRSMLHLVDQLDEAERAAATLVSVIDASIAAQRPQPTPNTRKAGRDMFWNEMVAVWISIGGETTGIAPAEFLVATSKPVFDKVRVIGGHKTMASMPQDHHSVVEWLRLRTRTRQRRAAGRKAS
jgi:hypothetical protein